MDRTIASDGDQLRRERVYRPASLTALYLKAFDLEPGIERATIHDSEVKGLALRISASGVRSWSVTGRRWDGRQRRFTIPHSSSLGLAQARAKARALIAELDKGADPVAERREQRQARQRDTDSQLTLAGLLERYAEEQWKIGGRMKSWSEREAHIKRELKPHIDKPAAALTADHLRRMVDAARDRGAAVSGRRCFDYLAPTLRWAVRRHLLQADVTAAIGREERADWGKDRERDRVLTPAELAALWKALGEVRPTEWLRPYADVMRFLLLTGQRLGEVTAMVWRDVDLDQAEWYQADNKAGRPHRVPLSPAAVALLEGLPARRQAGRKAKEAPKRDPSAPCFQLPSGKPLHRRTSNWTRASQLAQERSSTSGWTRHDLRRTVATLLAELGTDPLVIELLLNHADSRGRMGRIYNRFGYRPKLVEAVELLARHIQASAGGT